MTENIRIRPGRAADAATLPDIERSAGDAFRTVPDIAWVADEPVQPAEINLPLIAAGTVWVAEDAESGLVGFLRSQVTGDALFIIELAVARPYQQKGIGRQLIDASVAHARAAGLAAVTLTTFTHVAWNAPFYARYGFQELARDALSDHLRRQLHQEEVEIGLPNRCAMRLML
jgi:GNAT superfamily N-acetyltransferase